MRFLRSRVLSTRTYLATKSHGLCKLCNHPIKPGDLYENSFVIIYTDTGKRHRTDCKHCMCPEEWFREQDEQMEEDLKNRDQVIPPAELPAAA